MAWTLEYNGQEQSFEQWGLAAAPAGLQIANMAPDIFTVRVPGALVESDALFPFEAAVIVRKERVFGAGAWSGGVVEFQGKRLECQRTGAGDYEGMLYTFEGPWYDIQETPFQQIVKVYTGDPDNLTSVILTEVVLFQRVTGAGTTEQITSGGQITDTLQHLLDQYTDQGLAAPYQIGTIEPAVPLMTYPTKDVKCSQVIEQCLRPSPNCVVWFDYAFTPPKLHVTSQASMAAVVVAIGDQVKHKVLELRDRPDLQPRGVVLHFKRSHLDNGYTWIERITQKAPVDGPEGGLRVVVETIDLQGYTRQDVTGELVCSAVENNRAWWAKYCPELRSMKTRGFSIGAMTVKDKDGNAVSLATYPNTLDDGSIAPWMTIDSDPVISKQVTIEAEATFNQWDVEATGGAENAVNGRLLVSWVRKTLHVRVTVTNGITGTYSAVASVEAAETVPAGMAQAIYDATSTLQWDGRVVIVEDEVAAALRVGSVLNLSGSRAEWATMRAIIQTVDRNYTTGESIATVGPASHLSAGDLTQLFLVNRFRLVLQNPLMQATARRSESGGVALGSNAPKENSSVALPERQFFAVAKTTGANAVMVASDAQNSKWDLHTVDANGSQVAGAAVRIALGDCGGKSLYIQEQPICINGVIKHIRLLCSDPY